LASQISLRAAWRRVVSRRVARRRKTRLASFIFMLLQDTCLNILKYVIIIHSCSMTLLLTFDSRHVNIFSFIYCNLFLGQAL
jgi:hypothetical protein